MKNKVKFFGIVMLILITLFCSVVIACSDDDDDDGGSQSTNPDDPGGPGGPGGPGDPGDPGTPTLSGNVTISPASAVINQLLTATYSGTEVVSYQWRINGADRAGATGTQHIADEAGTYQVIVSAAGYPSKASNTVTVTTAQPPTQSAGALIALITGTAQTPLNLGNRKFHQGIYTQGFGHGDMGSNNTLPYAYFFQIRNDTSATIENITFTLLGRQTSPFNVSNDVIADKFIIGGGAGQKIGGSYPMSPELGYNFRIDRLYAGQSSWVAVQPASDIPAGYHYDVLRIQYPADPSKVIEIHLQFLLQKDDGLRLPLAARAHTPVRAKPAAPNDRYGHTITVTTNRGNYIWDIASPRNNPELSVATTSGAAPTVIPTAVPSSIPVGYHVYTPEYAIMEADTSNPWVPPANPPATGWIKDGEILVFNRDAAGAIISTTRYNHVDAAALNAPTPMGNTIQFRNLEANKPYWIYSRLSEDDSATSNYERGPILYNNPGYDGAPLSVTTLPMDFVP